jgi:phosphotransferase system HPr (HPr) family protein
MNPTQSCNREVVVSLENGLHLTPSSQIVQLAQKFSCRLLIRKGERVADGKSMLDLMQLAAEQGEMLRLEAEGDDAADAIAAIARLFEQNFQSDQVD